MTSNGSTSILSEREGNHGCRRIARSKSVERSKIDADDESRTLLRPTFEAVADLQFAFDFFNEKLFGGELPDCKRRLITHRLTA